MKSLKTILNSRGPELIEKLGYFINPLLLYFKNENDHLLVFYFHGLFKSADQKNLNHVDPQSNMTVNQFIEFIDYFLNKNYYFIKPEELHTGLDADKRYIMITFDDGYFNNKLAIEVIEKFKIPATFFITTRNMIENKSFWWDIVYKYRTKQGCSLDSIRKEQIHLKDFKYTFINNYIEHNFGIESFEPWSDIDRPFSESEVKSIAINPYVTIGNHTHNHSILVNYSNEEINEEVNNSNRILFDLTGKLPSTFAFPNGNYNKQVIETIESAGFRSIYTTEQKRNSIPIGNCNFDLINRYMADTMDIRKYGSFYRLGYNPQMVYFSIKSSLRMRKKLKT